jgi:hypothetical protein
MRIRRPRLGVRVVAVIPQRDQPEIGHRREGGRPRPDHHPRTTTQPREEGPVTSRRPKIRRQRDESARAENGRTGCRQPLKITSVGREQQRTTTGGRTDRRGLSEGERPVRTRYGGPDRPRRLRPRDRVEEPGWVRRPFGAGGGQRRRRGLVAAQRLAFDLRVAWRHREAGDIRQHSGVPVGDRATEVGDLRRQHLLR